MTGGPEHLPRHRLEEILGEGPDPAARAHLAGCERCAARLAALDEARANHARAYPAAPFARKVMARAARRRWGWRSPRTFAIGAGLAAACVALILVLRPTPEPGGEGIRLKGGAPLLQVYVQRGGAPRLLSDGDRVSAGERLAFACVLPAPRYVVLWGRDRSGEMTRWYPSPLDPPALLPAGRAQLPVGVELDAAPGEERFIAVLSSQPLDDELSRRAARGETVPGVDAIALRFEKP
jgi:hypothetical protein